MSRYQRHEIIKYVKSRLPIFLAQIQQFLQNVLSILSNLTEEEKAELVVYLVPEIKASLGLLTDVIIEIKSSLEKMCTDFTKDANSERNLHSNECNRTKQESLNNYCYNSENVSCDTSNIFDDGPRLKRFDGSEHNLKFVLYIYEVKKMRDIYGRVTTALDIIQQKRFLEYFLFLLFN